MHDYDRRINVIGPIYHYTFLGMSDIHYDSHQALGTELIGGNHPN